MTTKQIEADVLVIGGGPTGMVLALALGRRGVSVALVEMRTLGVPPSVKCNHISARTMEIFRRLGVAQTVRDADGLPGDFPHDAVARTTVAGIELSRVHIPSRDERRGTPVGPDTAWPTPEPPHRMNQIYMEPVLAQHVKDLPGITVLEHVPINAVEERAGAIVAEGVDQTSGNRVVISAQYVAGCEGGRSLVRKAIGAHFVGMDVVERVQTTYIRSPRILELFGGRPAWITQIVNSRRSGAIIAVDGRECWLVFNHLVDGEDNPAAVDRDWAIRTMLGVDQEFEYEVLGKEDWIGRRLVADKMRGGRMFIAGDAAHLWPPVGGNGMNAGVADAEALGWMLAATLECWGGPKLLDAYERERLPVVDQVSRVVVKAALRRKGLRAAIPVELELLGPEGDEVRKQCRTPLYEAALDQYTPGGLSFGYHYDHSPIIAYDGEEPPEFDMRGFVQSTTPGCRTPHVWLADGKSVYDPMGTDYALLRTDPETDVSGLVEAAQLRRVPLRVIDIDMHGKEEIYDRKLVLSRPDRHIAWRGNTGPDDATALIDLVRGASN